MSNDDQAPGPVPARVDIREQPGRETANERYARLREAGELTGWAGYCTVPDYCTRPCVECAATGRLADAATGARA